MMSVGFSFRHQSLFDTHRKWDIEKNVTVKVSDFPSAETELHTAEAMGVDRDAISVCNLAQDFGFGPSHRTLLL